MIGNNRIIIMIMIKNNLFKEIYFFNTYQQLSFFTAEKSDIRVRATTISSVNFTIMKFVIYMKVLEIK